jgi:hypothetical protein
MHAVATVLADALVSDAAMLHPRKGVEKPNAGKKV